MAASDEVPLLDRLWRPRRRRRARPDEVHRRPARGGPGHRVGDGLRASTSAAGSEDDRAGRRRGLRRRASCVAVAGYIALSSYNAVVALRQRIDKAWSNIGVVLKQRHDLLPNLVAAVRGLMAYERDVLTRVTEARAAYTPTAPIPDQAATSEATSAAVRSLFAVVERYPEIKSADERPGPPGPDRAARRR